MLENPQFLHLMYDMSLVEIGVFYILVYWWTVDHAQINVFLGDSLVGYDLKYIVLFFLTLIHVAIMKADSPTSMRDARSFGDAHF